MAALGKIAGLLAASGLDTGFAAIAVERQVQIESNGAALFPTASTFKVPVMVEVYAQARAGRFALNDRITFSERFRVVGSGVLQTLSTGLQPTIRDLMMLMTIVSDNTATDILCDLVGRANVVERMRSLGLEHIHVPMDCHGLLAQAWNLPPDRQPDFDYPAFKAKSRQQPMSFASAAYRREGVTNVASAIDMARLMALIAMGKAGTREDCVDMIAILEAQLYQDRVPLYLPTGCAANKTGSLRGLRNDVGLIRRGAGDTIAFALFTFDNTDLPNGNSRALVEANARISRLMGEVGQVLWDEFARR